MNGIHKRLYFFNFDSDSSSVLKTCFEKSEVILILGSVHEDNNPRHFFVELVLCFIARIRNVFLAFILFVVSIEFPAIEDPTNSICPQNPSNDHNNQEAKQTGCADENYSPNPFKLIVGQRKVVVLSLWGLFIA